MSTPRIQVSTVGSYPVPDWLAAYPNEQSLVDATRVIFATQRDAGVDLPTDGELYRFDVDHPDTNGMIEYFTGKFEGVDSRVGRGDLEAFRAKSEMGFRAKPAGIVRSELEEGVLNLPDDCERAASVANGSFKFTLTSPYMLARTLLDLHYGDFEKLTLAIAEILAKQAKSLSCACLQVDEANVPGNHEDGPLAAEAINRVLDAFDGEKAVHLCFGNYGGQTIQSGTWEALLAFLNALRTDHVVLELAHRPSDDLEALRQVDDRIALGIGVIDVKVNQVETADEVARSLEQAEAKLGEGRVRWIHPDCGFWMLKRSVADRKIAALAAGRDLYLGQ
ncbi:MAG: methionine synthase [Opitutales bacterium]|nr:methionine synthase [Opitutales bacterium]